MAAVAYSGVMLCARCGSYEMVHRDLIPLIAECVPLDVALVFRFINFYRTVALSDNMVVKYIANTMTFAYRSTMGQNVRNYVQI